jgi:hypothetical protein
MISVTAFLYGELLAAAVLALWVTARFPNLGPKSLRSAIAFLAVGLGLVQFLPSGVDLMLRLTHGAFAALFGCALPCLFGAFLSAAWMMRLLASGFGGSNGDRGHRVPAPARG